MALEGVTRHGLQTATKQIMQGSLGHAFLPSPPELRQECDKVMKPILEARARDSYDRRILKEMVADNTRAKWTRESRARASAKWQDAKAQQRLEGAREEAGRDRGDTSPVACMARLEAAAKINGQEFNPDNLKNAPRGGSFKRIVQAA